MTPVPAIRLAVAIVCLLFGGACTSPSTVTGEAQRATEATSIDEADSTLTHALSFPEIAFARAVESNQALSEYDCAAGEGRWTDGEDIQFFFEPSATQAAIGQLRAELDGLEQVERSIYEGKEESFEALQEMLANSPNLSENPPFGLSIDDVPTRLGLIIAAPVDENVATLIDSFEDDPLLFEIVERPVFCPATIDQAVALCTELDLLRSALVFIEPSAPAREATRIGELLESAGVFSSLIFVDQEEGLAQFQERYDLPTGTITLEDTSPYWDLELPMDADITALFDDLERDSVVLTTKDSDLCQGLP